TRAGVDCGSRGGGVLASDRWFGGAAGAAGGVVQGGGAVRGQPGGGEAGGGEAEDGAGPVVDGVEAALVQRAALTRPVGAGEIVDGGFDGRDGGDRPGHPEAGGAVDGVGPEVHCSARGGL